MFRSIFIFICAVFFRISVSRHHAVVTAIGYNFTYSIGEKTIFCCLCRFVFVVPG
uniref:Uncharacterized protein n=1 Tax=Anguilla anguilla TaxID=7936 RepID=A0A0E9X2G2_ANGAN